MLGSWFMKKLLGIIFLNLFLICEYTNAEKINFRELEIETGNQKFIKLKYQIIGHYENVRYYNNFYSYVDNKNLKSFIETFNFNAGAFKSHSKRWFKKNVSEKNSKKACDKSSRNIFFSINEKKKYITCLIIRIIKHDELSSPSFSKAEYAPLKRRPFVIQSYIKKNKIIVPTKMFRAEHYFYADGKIYWIFFTSEIDVNSKQQLDKYTNYIFQNHKQFEKQLEFEPRSQLVLKQNKLSLKSSKVEENKKIESYKDTSETKDIVFKLNNLKKLLDEGLITREEFDKAKTLLLNK